MRPQDTQACKGKEIEVECDFAVDYEVIGTTSAHEISCHFDDKVDADEHVGKMIKSGKWLAIRIIRTQTETTYQWEKE